MTGTSVLITGGAGFIGSNLAGRLALEGSDVLVADSLHPQVHSGGWPENLPTNVTSIPFDVTVPTQWDALLKVYRPDVVVHLAAETGTGQSLTEASRHGHVNVVGTTELLDGLSRADHVPERFVLASSRAVYGEGLWATDDGEQFYASARDRAQMERAQWDPQSPHGIGPARPAAHRARTTEARPTNIYAATKLAQEHIMGAWAAAHGCALRVLRLQNVYGPGQSLTNPYTGIVSFFAQLAKAQNVIPVYEDGRIVRDFVFISDVVAALYAAIHLNGAGTTTVDIGSGQAVTLHELALELARQCAAPAPEITGQFRLGDVRAAFADLSDAKDALNYVPRTPVDRGVALLLDWISAQDAPS